MSGEPSARRTRALGAPTFERDAMEALEPRRLLAHDLAIIDWNTGLGPPVERVIEATLGDDDTLVGAQYAPSTGAFGPPSGFTGVGGYSSFGAFDIDETGANEPALDLGATFRFDQGSSAGWLHGLDTVPGGFGGNDASLLVERSLVSGDTAVLSGTWNIVLLANNADFGGTLVAYEGTLTFSGTNALLLSSSLGGFGLLDTSFGVAAGERGKFTFDDTTSSSQAWAYLNLDASVLIGADGGVGDGDGFVFAAFRSSAPEVVDPARLPGTYRLSTGYDVLWASTQGPNNGALAELTELVLHADNTFTMTDLYRDTSAVTGTWSSDEDRIDLSFDATDKGVRTLSLFVTPNGRTLMPYLDTLFGDEISLIGGVFGLGARVDSALPPPPTIIDPGPGEPDPGEPDPGEPGGGEDPGGGEGSEGQESLPPVAEPREPVQATGPIVAGYADVDGLGRAVAFYQNAQGEWFRADLFDASGLDALSETTLIATGVETELDTITGELKVFATVGAHLYLFNVGADGVWHANNLGEQLAGALPVGGSMTAFQRARAGALSTDLHVAALD
ncbi:MAG: hypothetical protein AAGK04_06615, partial [Planctomycetota bacterium]